MPPAPCPSFHLSFHLYPVINILKSSTTHIVITSEAGLARVICWRRIDGIDWKVTPSMNQPPDINAHSTRIPVLIMYHPLVRYTRSFLSLANTTVQIHTRALFLPYSSHKQLYQHTSHGSLLTFRSFVYLSFSQRLNTVTVFFLYIPLLSFVRSFRSLSLDD